MTFSFGNVLSKHNYLGLASKKQVFKIYLFSYVSDRQLYQLIVVRNLLSITSNVRVFPSVVKRIMLYDSAKTAPHQRDTKHCGSCLLQISKNKKTKKIEAYGVQRCLLKRCKPTRNILCFLVKEFTELRCTQEPGEGEADFSSDTVAVFRRILANRDPKPPLIPKEIGFRGVYEDPVALPSWLTEDDINHFANKFNETGFTGGLNYYRALNM